MSELADETDSKSVIRTDVWVRAPPPAENKIPENVEFINKIGDLFLFILIYGAKRKQLFCIYSRNQGITAITYLASASAISSLYTGRLLNVAK